MMKLYFPKEHYDKSYRSHVFPLLKPFLKNDGFTNEQRISIYGVSENDFSFVTEMTDSSLVILPMSWDYYLLTNQLSKAKELIARAADCNKRVVVTTVGDYGTQVPNFSNVFVLRTSGYHSSSTSHTEGIPVFINDPLERIYDTTIVETNYSKLPIIGFCGQTNSSLLNACKEILKVTYRNLKHYLKLSINAPQKIQANTYNRSCTLNTVKKAVTIEANFIERKKYRAGIVTVTDRKKTEREFYDNMLNSNYVICIRGAGNFSVRLYETLAMGRIPVFVNTDCLLPLPEAIDWKKHVVWVEFNELDRLEELVLAFHDKFTPKEFKLVQQANRKLWENKLTLSGFFNSYLKA